MADKQYRLLWNSLPSSKKIRAVTGKKVTGAKWWKIACHLVYTWLIAWQDDDGRLRGRPGWIVENILPFEELTSEEVADILQELHRVGLIQWYEAEDDKFIEICDGSSHQKIRKDRYKSSTYPKPTQNAAFQQPSDNQVATNQQPSDNPLSSSSSSSTPSSSSIVAEEVIPVTMERHLSELLFSLIKERDKNAKEPNWKEWENEMRLLHERDSRPHSEISDVIRWCQGDDFWKNNILSPRKLRAQFSQLKLKMEEKSVPKYLRGLKKVWEDEV